jgi:hypothetical protein
VEGLVYQQRVETEAVAHCRIVGTAAGIKEKPNKTKRATRSIDRRADMC